MFIELEGIFLSPYYNLVITEKFAKRFCIDVKKHWIAPFGYYDHGNCSIISNNYFPDGVYICLGWAVYPGTTRPSNHIVGQFNLLKCRGIDVIAAGKFNNYPDLPKSIPLRPVFPLFKVGELEEWKQAKKSYLSSIKLLPLEQLEAMCIGIGIQSISGKIFNLKLALERAIRSHGTYSVI